MTWPIYNSFKRSQCVYFTSIRFPLIKITFIILSLFNVTILLINYNIVFPTISTIWKELSSDTATTNHDIHRSKRLPSTKKISNFSRFRCTGDENNIDTWSERLCIFNNICYNVELQQFEYYRQLHSPNFPIFYDSARGMLSDFSIKQNGQDFVSLTSRGGQSWAPTIVNQSHPSINVTWLTNLHTLWREYFSDNNIGHMVWEDMGSIFYSLERMNIFDKQLVVMHSTPVSQNLNYQKFVHDILSVLTSEKLHEYKSYLTTFKSKYVCFRHLMVGGNMVLFHPAALKENNGREKLLYEWRSKIITHHKFDPEYIPNQHQIVITNKSTSVWAKAPNGMHRAIANLKEVITFVKNTYPNIPVQVIEWHKLGFVEQIKLLLKTTILISPTGGVSLIAPFLPYGSHAIVMDYYVARPAFGFTVGSSASMDGMVLNHFPHFKKDYYQIYGKQDYVFDFNGTSDTRNDASIIVNTTRLHLLIESAIEDMNL